MTDQEKGHWEAEDGFPAVASFISRDPDSETYVFRKFKTLTARTLLHLQSELIDLEHQLETLDREAASSTDINVRRSLRNWEHFKKQNTTKAIERKRLSNDIESTLRRYHKLLLLESDIAKLEGPSNRVLQALLTDFKGGPNGTDHKLGGRSEHILDDKEDLVALRKPQNNDLLSTLLLNHWLFPTKDLSSNRSGEIARARYFHEATLLRIVNIVTTIIAGALLIGSILTLYFVTSPHLRLILVIVFMVVFAIGLGCTTSASRDSMFAATATYAAILVVFISGNLGGGSSS